jgi:hypothetical protein
VGRLKFLLFVVFGLFKITSKFIAYDVWEQAEKAGGD